ncbi:alpha-glucosidase C-terminal domain-containing protein, partial [candidate division KSB1 bacterium]|nr:alpha-glucosidase C-terminal domain-containing protein [candidate division KSB1 bacterium]
DSVSVNQDLFEHYKKLIHIRRRFAALNTGSYQTLLADDSMQVHAFERALPEQRVIVLLNNSAKNQKIKLPFEQDGKYFDVLNDRMLQENAEFLDIPAKWGMIFIKYL